MTLKGLSKDCFHFYTLNTTVGKILIYSGVVCWNFSFQLNFYTMMCLVSYPVVNCINNDVSAAVSFSRISLSHVVS